MSQSTKQAFVADIEKVHGRNLRRFFSLRLRKMRSDLPDLVQEVFLRLLRIEHHETIRNPQAYLFTVASHVLHQHALRQAETAEVPGVMPDLEPTSDEYDDPAVQAELEQRLDLVGRGLERLAPRAYATLVLHRGLGLPLEEVASQLGISLSMVKKHLARALAYCQQHLQELE